MQLCVGLFDKSNPHLIGIFAMAKNRFFLFLVDNNSLINNNINPLKVFEEP